MSAKRLFISISIPEHIQAELASCRDKIKEAAIRWVEPENLHITLQFIGDVASEAISELENKLRAQANREPFVLQFKEVTPVKRQGKLSMIWASLEESHHFTQLANRLGQALSIDSKHPPTPHVTLARVKKGSNPTLKVTDFPPIAHLHLPVASFHLMESQLRPQGPVYSVIREFQLTDKVNG